MRNLILYITIAIIVIVTFWYSFEGIDHNTGAIQTTLEAQQKQLPDAFITGLSSVQYLASGNKDYLLISPRALHYQKTQTTKFETPYITLYKNEKPHQTAQSEQGLLFDNKTLQLKNNVIFRQLGSANNHIKLTTETMIIDSTKNIAKTDKPVTIVQQHGITHATGMIVYYKKNLMNLNSKVKGTYEAR